MTQIRIDAPGAGEWIMKKCDAHFIPERMRVFSNHTTGSNDLLGGFVMFDYYPEGSAMINMAGARPGWCTRDLLWMVFEFCFHQTTARKLFAAIRSDNDRSLELCLRAGWRMETTIRDVYPGGVHAIILFMTEATCPWLEHRPKTWQSGRDNVLLFG
jgi:RimJ/RimL family protein N-acetyltransferase